METPTPFTTSMKVMHANLFVLNYHLVGPCISCVHVHIRVREQLSFWQHKFMALGSGMHYMLAYTFAELAAYVAIPFHMCPVMCHSVNS